ncbi:MAG: hypothetical protein BMS9Abin02_1410 [Anaerolineae bacterium]|nr:MAG: hypothetical protein BMS9Abin02_1410 [Anaerolineae bacterium]
MSCVVDASVIVSYLHSGDSNHGASRNWLHRQVEGGQLLAAPILLIIEVSAAVARRTRSSALGHQAINNLQRLPMLRLVAIDHRLGLSASKLGADLYLRGADAVYVALALQLSLPLVSWDKEQLERASRAINVQKP